MKAVILCGGMGTRIRDVSELIPKPMLPIGGKPILWHIMKLYSYYGVTEFILCLGYKGWMIKEFFYNFKIMTSDCTLTLGSHTEIEFHEYIDEAEWKVTLVDTGENSMTGNRVYQIRKFLENEEHFCLTYGDGVADIDIGALIDKHRSSGMVGTISAVRVAGRFGELNIVNDTVSSFSEKPAQTSGRISGGFMVFDAQQVWKHFNDKPELILERDPINSIIADNKLGVYEHDGYWQCMDTLREYNTLNELWESGKAPWKIW